jgi:tRNA pseudouridine38-40 synthase
MNEAAAPLLGLHDFAAYCRPREGATTIRELQELSWERISHGEDAGIVTATVAADAFCHSLVRSLVGSAIAVGEGKKPPAWMADVLAGRDRSQAAAVAPAHGLTLERVTYPPDAEVGKRAQAIRARRSAKEIGD